MSECMLEVAEWVSSCLLLSGKNRNMLGEIAQRIYKRDSGEIKQSTEVFFLSTDSIFCFPR